jgi:exopolyphosphatase / guanosine-5'-triphosphate,3'-diphosphate pyrophosphatase
MTLASIDIGTNTVLLLIAEVFPGSQQITVLHNEYRIPRIGIDLLPGGNISEEKKNEFYQLLKEYTNVIDSFKCESVLAAATNAFRIAGNSSSIIAEVKALYGIEINVITGDQEAELSFLGAVSSFKDDETKKLVIDIGGGSTEIVYGTAGAIDFRRSFPAGVVSSSEKFFEKDTPDRSEFINFLIEVFKELEKVTLAPVHSIAVAGTPTTLACIKKNINIFDEEKVEGTILTQTDLEKMTAEMELLKPAGILNKYTSVVKGREDLILSGAYILLYLLKVMKLPEIIVSTKGLRYGLVFNFLRSQYLRF